MADAAAALAKNARLQIERLLTQLSDLEDAGSEYEASELEEMRAETLGQLEAFRASLARVDAGDVTLRDELQVIKEATSAAIARAFKTPEVLRMFALRQPDALRERLRRAERDATLGKMSAERARTERVEVLTALKKLGAPLEAVELDFLREHMTAGLADFVAAES